MRMPQDIDGHGSPDGGHLPERRWPHSSGLSSNAVSVGVYIFFPGPMRPDNVHNGCCGVASRRILGQTVQAPAQLAA